MRALAANKLRSILTMLGIIIGVGAVIALMSIGRGVEKYVTDQFAGLGSNLLFIAPGQFCERSATERGASAESLTLSDMRALADGSYLPDVAALPPSMPDARPSTARARMCAVGVSGVTPSFPEVRNWAPTVGNFFTQQDFDERARVVAVRRQRLQRTLCGRRISHRPDRAHQQHGLPGHRRHGGAGRRSRRQSRMTRSLFR